MRAKIVLRVLLLLSPSLLSGCATIDLSSIDLPAINLPWDKPAVPETAALRGDTAEAAINPPDGLQVEDLRAPFGGAPQTSASLTGGSL
jgi:hypothetical protein